jgi:glycosyltransferase involved in cell wall biosynthesis
MKISILTPTYNRAYTLPKLYKSLIKNADHKVNFEWLIMDDGSTDDTEQLINKYIKENKIEIHYIKQDNQGKMVALNNLNKHIKGNIVVECDSDDYLDDDCFLNIKNKWTLVENDDKISGLAFLRIYPNKKVIGTNFKYEKVAKIFDIYFKDQVKGDKCLIFKANIRKKYFHRLENNERFITEGRMYNEIDKTYSGLLCFNIPGIVCEYLPDGYTLNIDKLFKNNPHGYYKYYQEMLTISMNGVSFKTRLHLIKHYILFSYLTNINIIDAITKVKGTFNIISVSILIIPGYFISRKKRQFN